MCTIFLKYTLLKVKCPRSLVAILTIKKTRIRWTTNTMFEWHLILKVLIWELECSMEVLQCRIQIYWVWVWYKQILVFFCSSDKKGNGASLTFLTNPCIRMLIKRNECSKVGWNESYNNFCEAVGKNVAIV